MQALTMMRRTAREVMLAAAQGTGLSKAATTKPSRMWLDPICTLIALAILSLKPKGTKLHFNGRRIIYDEPGSLQGPTRQFIHGGSSRELHHLVTPLFYAALSLKPSENESYKILFTLAQIAFKTLIDITYAHDPQVGLCLTTAHQRILEKAMKGKKIKRESFLVPDQTQHPITTACLDYWLSETSPLKEIARRLEPLREKSEGKNDISQDLKAIEAMLEPAHQMATEGFDRITTGDDAPFISSEEVQADDE